MSENTIKLDLGDGVVHEIPKNLLSLKDKEDSHILWQLVAVTREHNKAEFMLNLKNELEENPGVSISFDYENIGDDEGGSYDCLSVDVDMDACADELDADEDTISESVRDCLDSENIGNVVQSLSEVDDGSVTIDNWSQHAAEVMGEEWMAFYENDIVLNSVKSMKL